MRQQFSAQSPRQTGLTLRLMTSITSIAVLVTTMFISIARLAIGTNVVAAVVAAFVAS